ncbi:DUF1254 domain-containing protein [Nocardia sp. SYP-A9097]|uniref:DUF1254 domain-containing protein n=1 Tax=Nocardia sp. SYP-A9097 TaxID=2663237 RepID=UPI00281697E9|nr:DUF1254 domain-containing protein [Nocardia sp. SYP-A9097]
MTQGLERFSISRRGLFGMAAGFTAVIGLAACGSSNDSSSSSSTSSVGGDSDPKAIAVDAYVFGYPLVLMDTTRTTAAPTNTLMRYSTTPTPDDKTIVSPNVDTLYAQAWLDLSAEPMVIQMPTMPDRYWLVQVQDAWSNTVNDPSSMHPKLADGAPAGPFTYVLTGPGWSGQLPTGTTRLEVPTPTSWVIVRMAVNNAADHDAVVALQDQIKLMPLSAWNTNPDTPTPSAAPQDPTANSAKEVDAMDGPTFFAKLNALMVKNPPASADADAVKRFATIGIAPGGTVKGIDTATLNDAVSTAKQQISSYQNPKAKLVNDWAYATNLGTYGTDYPLRANTALIGLGANLAADAIYPMMLNVPATTNGTPRRLRVHFAPGQLPPVDAFWSLTAYTADRFLVPNPDNIHSIGHQIPVTLNPDGSADLTLQSANPGSEVPQGNWLPIPDTGTLNLALRLYAPKQAAADGTWQPPALNQIN